MGLEGMTVLDNTAALVPLRTDFDLVWRGYDRDQVRDHVASVEADLRLLAADRDAAVAQVDELTRQLEAARATIRELTTRVDRICRTPVEPGALTERLRRMVELAEAEAAEITTRARAAAEQSWTETRATTDRLRRRHEQLVAEVHTRRQEMETEHRELMRRAHERIETMTRQAERRRRELDDQAARLRAEIQADFEVAMAARRDEAMRAIGEQRSAAQAHADDLVRRATERAHRIIADARDHAGRLQERRERIAAALRDTQRLLRDADPLLAPLPEETDGHHDDPLATEDPPRQEISTAA